MIRGRLASGRRNQNLRRWEREMGQLLGNQAAAPRGIKRRVARWPGQATPRGHVPGSKDCMSTRCLDTQAHGSQEPSVHQQVKDKLHVVRPVRGPSLSHEEDRGQMRLNLCEPGRSRPARGQPQRPHRL